jgi:hypothetical protein
MSHGRPLIITDCDEVILHMVAPFRGWLAQEHDIVFTMNGNDFSRSMRRKGELLIRPRCGACWAVLRHRDAAQNPIAGAMESLTALGEHADVVCLTNLEHHRNEARTQQLAHGLPLRSTPIRAPRARRSAPSLRNTPQPRGVHRRHRPASRFRARSPRRSAACILRRARDGPHITCAFQAGHAHARIDDWAGALPWLMRNSMEKTMTH